MGLIGELFIFLTAFLISLNIFWFSMPIMRKLKWVDLDWFKKGEIWVPTGGMISWLPLLLMGFIMFYFGIVGALVFIWLAMIAAIGGVGFIDDLGRKERQRVGFKPRFLVIAITCSLFAIFFGQPIAVLTETIDSWWLWMPMTALFVAGMVSFENTFGGINGWNGGSTAILAMGLVVITWNTPFLALSLAHLGMVLAFALMYMYPASIFPGDTFPFVAGVSLATIGIFTNNMLWITLLFIPHMADSLIKQLSNRDDISQKKFMKEGKHNIKGKVQYDLGIRPYYYNEKTDKLEIPKYPDKKERLDFTKAMIKIFGPMNEGKIARTIWYIVGANTIFVLILYSLFA
ncbi:MAG: glycosyltransferase family 4 protein [Candidatus Diapherotrites archaeon]|nr:glycosyltransferase family 4 protein [Candidatus Diapherotrites archaeon]